MCQPLRGCVVTFPAVSGRRRVFTRLGAGMASPIDTPRVMTEGRWGGWHRRKRSAAAGSWRGRSPAGPLPRGRPLSGLMALHQLRTDLFGLHGIFTFPTYGWDPDRLPQPQLHSRHRLAGRRQISSAAGEPSQRRRNAGRAAGRGSRERRLPERLPAGSGNRPGPRRRPSHRPAGSEPRLRPARRRRGRRRPPRRGGHGRPGSGRGLERARAPARRVGHGHLLAGGHGADHGAGRLALWRLPSERE